MQTVRGSSRNVHQRVEWSEDFPILGHGNQEHSSGGFWPLGAGPNDYYPYCNPEVRPLSLTQGCPPQFPYFAAGDIWGSSLEELPQAASKNLWGKAVGATLAFTLGLLGLGNSQRGNDPETERWYTPQNAAMTKGSMSEWVTGPWLVAIHQETYRQFNPPELTPWER